MSSYPPLMSISEQREYITNHAQHFRDFMQLLCPEADYQGKIDRQGEISWYILHGENKELYDRIEVEPWHASRAIKVVEVDIALAWQSFVGTNSNTMMLDPHAIRALVRLVTFARKIGEPHFPPGSIPSEKETITLEVFALEQLGRQLAV